MANEVVSLFTISPTMNELNIAPSTPTSGGSIGILPDSTERCASPHALHESRAMKGAGTPQPLSFSQRQVWLHAELAPGLPLYNTALILTRRGPLHQNALEQTLREIVRRHETLRPTFAIRDGIPVQIVAV